MKLVSAVTILVGLFVASLVALVFPSSDHIPRTVLGFIVGAATFLLAQTLGAWDERRRR